MGMVAIQGNSNIKNEWDVAAVMGNSLLAGLVIGGYAKSVLGGRHFVWIGLSGAGANLAIQGLVSQRKPHFWLGKGTSTPKEIAKATWKTTRIWLLCVGGAVAIVAAISLGGIEDFEMPDFQLPSRPTDDFLHELIAIPEARWEVWRQVAVKAPFFEEVLFRGMLFELCEGTRSHFDDSDEGAKISQAFQALLFGLAHTWDCKSLSGVAFSAAPRVVIGYFLVGQRTKSESLWPSTLSHATHNSFVLLFAAAVSQF